MAAPFHIIRHARRDDRNAIISVVRAAFENESEARLVDRLWAEDAFSTEIVAEVDGAIVAYCGFTPVMIDGDENDGCHGLAPAAVAPAFQGKGLGSEVVTAGIDELRDKHATLLVVLGEPNFYSRFGFNPASRYGLRWAVMDAGDAFQAISFEGATWKDRAIHYHAAFSNLDN